MAVDGAVRLGDPTNSGTASPTPLTLSASGLVSGAIRGDVQFSELTLSGSLEGPLSLPLLTLSASLASGDAADGSVRLPLVDTAGVMLAGSAGAGDATLSLLTLDASTGVRGDAVLLPLTLSASAVAGSASTADSTFLLPHLTLSGAVLAQGTGQGAATFAEFTLVAQAGTPGGIIVGVVTLPTASLSASAVPGNAGTGSITVPLVTLSAQTGILNVIGTAALSLPVLQLAGAMQQALASISITGISVNTRTKAASTYTGIAANSVARFNGVTLIATAGGIFALTGDTDNGTQIDAHILSGVSDLGDNGFKRVLTGYIGYEAAGDMEMTLITDEHHEYSYTLVPRRVNEQHATRVKFGRGVDGRYWQWKYANKNGCDFALDQLELVTAATGRKV